MEDESSDVAVGLAALKAWANMSANDRAHARAAFAAEGSPAPSLSIVVLDGNLPSNTEAAIISDPTNGGAIALFSRASYSDASLTMVAQALANKKFTSLRNASPHLRLTSSATVVNADLRPVMQLSPPEARLTRTSQTLDQLIGVATSVESISLSNFGPGKIYRFD